jgi:hypothetical protein
MLAKVIDFQRYKEACSAEEKSEYLLLKELMIALFGPMEEELFESPPNTSEDKTVKAGPL